PKNTPRTHPRRSKSVIERRRARIIAIVESLPDSAAVVCGDRNQYLSLEVRRRRFGYYLDDHHGDARVAINCKVEPGANQTLVDFAPERFHIPRYLGARGWVGLWIDLPSIDWDEVESILVDAYRLTAPKLLLKQVASKTNTRQSAIIEPIRKKVARRLKSNASERGR
ncbi:MAG TPA: MmcQ/YjbR family DNA-binding protein, partial [Blastocatellia bacterium]|nr:MmcQ/YjbR family DNA-binding protein [Blastocatellia bacterium]